MIHVEPAPTRPFRVAHDLDWAAVTNLRIVHLGQSGTLLESGAGSLVPVTWGSRGLAPGGVHLAPRDAAEARARWAGVASGRDLLDLRGWQEVPPLHRIRVDLHLPTPGIDAAAVARLRRLLDAAEPAPELGPAMDPSAQRALAPALAAALVSMDEAAVADLVTRLVGAGPGATPAGDDVLVGAFVGLGAAIPYAVARSRVEQAQQLLAATVWASLQRTSTASRHDLAAAIDGSYSERTLRMAAGISRRSDADAAHRAALTWGATSGVDFLHGLVALAEAVPLRCAPPLASTA